MPKMTERELLNIVAAEFEGAMGAPGGEIGQERAENWDYYLSKKFGNEVDGQSQVVTSDVADVVDGIMPSLLRIFTTAENLIEFEPVGPEDEPQARQESDYVNHVFFKENPAFHILYTWFFDALVQKNGIVKAWWDASEEVTTETYKGLTDIELAELLEDEELEAIERDERTETVEAPTQFGPVEQSVTVHDVTFKRTSKKGRPRVENVPPEEFRISADSRSVIPDESRMVGQEREMTRSELLEMGFDKELVDSLPSGTDFHETSEDISRHDKTDELDDAPHDRSQEKILVREAYIRLDWDGDGKSELRQVFTAGNKILSNEEADRQIFHIICPQPLPHKHFGRATAEKVKDIQLVQSTLARQVLDNLYHTNNPEHAVWELGVGENTLDDLLTRRAGKVNRFARPPAESWAPMTVPFTAAGSFPMMEYWDKVKRDRTGISSDGEGLDPEALKNIQTSVLAQAADLSKMKIEAVARIFAETGIKSLFRHIHELLQKHQDKEKVVRLRNEWVQVSPQEWRTRENMTVKIGLGMGTREQNLLHLNAIWEKQSEIIQGGGADKLVSGRNIFNTAAEIVKNANLKDPEMFFTDPGNQPIAQQEQDPAAQAQIQIAQRQQELDAARAELDAEKMRLQHSREMQELALKDQERIDKLMVEMEKIATSLTELELKFSENVPGAKT